MAKRQPKVIKKKVKPFPFEASLELNGIKKPVEVINVVPVGIVAQLGSSIIFVGEFYQLQFTLPVLKQMVTTKVRVMKTYDKAINPKEKKVERVAELLFVKLDDENRKAIAAFLSAIRGE